MFINFPFEAGKSLNSRGIMFLDPPRDAPTGKPAAGHTSQGTDTVRRFYSVMKMDKGKGVSSQVVKT